MAGRGIQYAGDYDIKEIKLFASSGNVIDLSEVVIAINIYEDIFSPSITGNIAVVDTNAIIMNAPITGQDYISFKITTPGLENQSIDFTENVMSIHRIDTRVSVSDRYRSFYITFLFTRGIER